MNKLTVDQGNVVSQSMMNDIELGMSKRQVQYVLGTPLADSPLNNDLWIYYFSFFTMGEFSDPKQVTKVYLYFEDSELVKIEGDLQPQDTEEKKLIRESEESVDESDFEEFDSTPINER